MSNIPEPPIRITQLVTPAMADALQAAAPAQWEQIITSALHTQIATLPSFYRGGHAPAPLTTDELQRADDLCAYRMPLVNGTARDMGLPYDWYFGASDGHIGERAPWYIVQRIDFSSTLVRAFRQTGDRRYLDALRNYYLDYVAQYWVDGPHLPPRDNWLCTAARCGEISTSLTDPEVLTAFSGADFLAIFRAVDHMLTGLIPNLALGSNWRVHELASILRVALSFPFLRQAERWQALAVNGLNEEFAIQIRDDGSHEELAIHYGAGTWLAFAALHALAAQRPDIGLRFDPDKMERALVYVLSACKPFGLAAAIGDDYGSRTPAMLDGVSAPHRQGTPPAWDRMVRQGAAWLARAGDSPTAAFILHGTPEPAWQSRHHRNSGYLFLRDGWQPEALYAGLNMGYYANCHCHYGLLGLEIAGLGREFIVDPGCSALDAREINQNFARTRAHSTLCVDGLDQQVAAPVTPSRLVLGAQYDFAVGVYKGGYVAGNPFGPGCTSAGRFTSAFSGTHFRHLLFVKGSYWMLFDALTTQPGHCAETRLQFLPTAITALPQGGYSTGWAAANLALLPLQWDGWTHDVVQGMTDPIEGWMPGPQKTLLPAPVYKATCPTGDGPCWHGSLLFPYPGATPPALTITALVTDAGFGYRIDAPAFTDYLFLSNSWNPRDIVLDAIRTDAPCLHLRLVDGQPTQAFTCEGTYLTVNGTRMFAAPGTMLAREWTNGAHGPAIRTYQPRWQG